MWLTSNRRHSARGAVYRTGIPLAAIDINELGTHAVIVGKDILRTVKVQDRNIFEDLNIRNAVTSYISTQSLEPKEVRKRHEFLPAKDVRWSHKHYAHVVATAAPQGRVALYDVSRSGSRVELHHIFQHKVQVHKLDFDPHAGYMLLSGDQNGLCNIWDIRDPKQPRGYAQYTIKAPVRDVRWSPTDAWEFALCTEQGFVQKWDVRTHKEPVLSIRAHEKQCYTLAWHPDGKHIVSGSLDKSLKVWDFKSENRRQKPVFQLRCPAGVMNLAWRPPCWSAEFAEQGTWQSTQIATSYTDEDPRLHVWDLRRPLIPFKELTPYDSRPTDLLWANKDLIWTVGGAGIFAQNDASFAPQPEESLQPGAIEWAADGTFYAVTEDRSERRTSSALDPAALFLNIPQARLSGAEEGLISRSLTDDEGTETSIAEYSSRRQSKATSTRSAKGSQTNTPPTHNDQPQILPLDRAVMAKKDMFINGQLAAMTRLPGIYQPIAIVEAAAKQYTQPMTQKERDAEPNQILPKLEKAFKRNAAVCTILHRPEEAKNWDILAVVVLTELKNWADNNRKRRLEHQAESKKNEDAQNSATRGTLSPFSKLTKDKGSRSPAARSEKVLSNMFRGVVEPQKGSNESGSHGGSNMTTPRQLAVLSSPNSTARQAGSTWFTLEDAIEPMQPLPPSLANAHSTAAAASRALLDTASDLSDSPYSSPEKSNTSSEKIKTHRRTATESVTQGSPKLKFYPAPTEPLRTPTVNRTHADRRAALRDYKAPTRQPFTLEAPITSPRNTREARHDSTESFPMFPASTSTSNMARSYGRNLQESVPESSGARQGLEPWPPRDGHYDSVGRSERSWEEEGRPNAESRDSGLSQAAIFEVDDSPDKTAKKPPQFDGAGDSKPSVPGSVEKQFRDVLARSPQSEDEVPRKPASPQPIPTSYGNTYSTSKARKPAPSDPAFHTNRTIHHINPHLPANTIPIQPLLEIKSDDPTLIQSYIPSDFRPIDIMAYAPIQPWSLSAYPIITSAIEIDSQIGKACSQFSAQLLSHLHPFFFHQSHRRRPTESDLASAPTQMSIKLQHPAFRHRMIKGLFAHHIDHLVNLGLSQHAAVLRKRCVEEFDYPSLAGPESRTKQAAPTGNSLKMDPHTLRASCGNCHEIVPINAKSCSKCKQARGKCPICEIPLHLPAEAQESAGLVSYCHTCGHSAHEACISTWLILSDVQGICPTPGCGCDCGPGPIREQRIDNQIKEREERETIRGSMSATTSKRDALRAGPSPAVDKARDQLRKSSAGMVPGGPQMGSSGDERAQNTGSSAWSKKGTSASVGRAHQGQLGRSASTAGSTPAVGSSLGGTSFGRRVRVVEPDEE